MHRCIAFLCETNCDKLTCRNAALAQRSIKRCTPVTCKIKTPPRTDGRQACLHIRELGLEAYLTQPSCTRSATQRNVQNALFSERRKNSSS